MQFSQKNARRGFRLGMMMVILAITIGVGLPVIMRWLGYAITANPTPSLPVGLYLSNLNDLQPKRGKIVGFEPHNDAAKYGYSMGWVRPGGWYIKRVEAMPGDTVCIEKIATISVNEDGQPTRFVNVGPVADVDRQGRHLPHTLSGCNKVPNGHFFAVGYAINNSYDGRYYGFVPNRFIRASLTPLWTLKEGKSEP